ncbi:putative L-lysine 2,3-aminomutase [Liberibacter crescens BT-1]|uniref:Putative L-lysine 2,3-aminomutase n=1 Tax=Liberibacter crescens (strain BT-1) TaxID=1215343 RepID=L0EW59_LIBCB|nr:lysine-2,3-aminomutase-like protein [Liberibacter crescens]AGA64606.1 putative L-lysine 2,3-aminomutase [Liberibacter crescens BT-1]AMC12730.1 lysine 2,3-aminomutase [Liberibacter crescens]
MKSSDRRIWTAKQLKNADLISDNEIDIIDQISKRYAIGLTSTIVKLINRHDPHDPIARQFIPQEAELNIMPQEREDPIGDSAYSPVEGIIHRYPDRVLLKIVHICPVYCRFCFRKEMIGPRGNGILSQKALTSAFSYIQEHPEIWEVILTGGDPLILSLDRIKSIIESLKKIQHIKILRFHTRVPIVIPEYINSHLIKCLKSSDKTIYIAIHANHPREFSKQALAALARLANSGISLVSQSVLLKGVNDDPEVLASLMRIFVEARVKPYYLHHLDLTPGTNHFRISIEEGQKIVSALRERLSGLCQPSYILDIPGGHGKINLNGSDIKKNTGDSYHIKDYKGFIHTYPPKI